MAAVILSSVLSKKITTPYIVALLAVDIILSVVIIRKVACKDADIYARYLLFLTYLIFTFFHLYVPTI